MTIKPQYDKKFTCAAGMCCSCLDRLHGKIAAMSSTPSFEDIKAIHREVIAANNGRVTIQWELNRPPDGKWEKYLQQPGIGKSGSAEFIAAQPTLVHLGSDHVRITVPEGDLETAVRWVQQAITAANEKFRQFALPDLQRAAAELQERRAADDAALQAAQDRLRRLDLDS